MRNFSLKYLFKFIVFILCALLIIFIVASILINNFLADSKTKIEQELGKHIRQKVFIENIQYSPSRSIILKNVSILKDKPSEESQIILIENIKLAFSLGKLIATKNFIITDIKFIKPTANYFECIYFLRENVEQIIKLIATWPKGQTVTFSAEDVSLALPREDGSIAYIAITALLKMQGESITGSGSIDVDSSSSKTRPLGYNLKAYLTENGIIIDNIELEMGDFYAKLWGILEGNILRINGFSSLSNFFYDYLAQKPTLNIIDRLKLSLYKRRHIPVQDIARFKSSLNIFNIDSLIKIVPPTIKIENLNFSINNIPFRLKGSVSFISGASLNITFSSYPDQPLYVWLGNLNKFDIKISGNLKKEKFNGAIWFDFLRKAKNKRLLQRIETIVKNLCFSFSKEKRLRMRSEEADLSYTSGQNLHKLFFKDFDAQFNVEDKRFKFVKFNSKIYDGLLDGQGSIDTSQFPFKCIFDIKLSDISAHRLNSVLTYFSKVYGRLDSQMHYQNHPQSNLDGKMTIYNGYLDGFEFFNWLAEFFNIPSLKEVDFNRLSANFLVNDAVAKLDAISLDSNEVAMGGYFGQYEDDLIASKLSLSLSKNLLETSPKFKSLLKLLGKDFSFLDFDFQLSGISEAMNFKWLESDFKRELQNRIPDFIERRIERNIEKAIEAISKDR